jgi:hypothetical protein
MGRDVGRPFDLAAQGRRALDRGRAGRRRWRRTRRRDDGKEGQHRDGTRAHRPIVVADAIAPGYPPVAERRRRFQSIIQTEPRFTQRSGRRAAGGVASAR